MNPHLPYAILVETIPQPSLPIDDIAQIMLDQEIYIISLEAALHRYEQQAQKRKHRKRKH